MTCTCFLRQSLPWLATFLGTSDTCTAGFLAMLRLPLVKLVFNSPHSYSISASMMLNLLRVMTDIA